MSPFNSNLDLQPPPKVAVSTFMVSHALLGNLVQPGTDGKGGS